MKAVAIPYIIAIILGVMIIVLVGYWFVAQGGKSVATGQSAECNVHIFNRCNGFAEWTESDVKLCNGMGDPKGTAKCGTSSQGQTAGGGSGGTGGSASPKQCTGQQPGRTDCPSQSFRCDSTTGEWICQ